MEAGELDPHLDPELGVEVGERLIEQENLGVAHDRASDGDALTLPARQLGRPAVEQVIEPQRPGRTLDDALPFRPGDAMEPEREAHVLGH